MADKCCRAVSGIFSFFPSVFWLAHMDLKVTHYIATSWCGLSLAAWIWTGLFWYEVDVKKTKQQETTGQKKCFSKLWTSHESRPVLTHVFNTAVTAWDLFVWLAQLSGKKPKINRPIKQNNTWPKLSDCCTSVGNTDSDRNRIPHFSRRHYELLSSFQIIRGARAILYIHF